MLTATLDNFIPTTLSTSAGSQVLTAPGVISFSINDTASQGSTPTSNAFRFVLNNVADGQLTTFTTTPFISDGDTAIAVYDNSGNRLFLQDADAGGEDDAESLSVALKSGQQYTVDFFGVTFGGFFSPDSITAVINAGPQTISDTVAINPSTGSGSLTTNNPPDSFTASTNVRYFPINLLDGGSTASIVITPDGPDTAVDATLYLENANGTYHNDADATLADGAASATLTPVPATGTNTTDGTYILSIAPLNFTAAAEPLVITVSSSSLLSPGTVTPASSVGSITEAYSQIGLISGQVTAGFTNHTAALYSILAPTSGSMTVVYAPTSGFAPVLSIYGPGGTPMLTTVSQTTTGTVSTTFNVTAGGTYYALAGVDDSSQTGQFVLTAEQSYTSIALSPGATAGTADGNLAGSQRRFAVLHGHSIARFDLCRVAGYARQRFNRRATDNSLRIAAGYRFGRGPVGDCRSQ